ncbi:MAG: alpha/beta hydrolase [Deltaproteobacteria bacterium]|nr:alpha/beta hydrolase [Deltaproteobacteria bacterium]
MRKYFKWIFTGLFILLGIAVAYPFVAGDMETLELDNAARASMPNESFVKLSDGYTHYEWAGPENGQPVVLVCGALTPLFIWDYEFKTLADSGFHVLRYDHFGRGLSDRPDYRADLYDRQLLELLNSQNIKTPVDLVGRSMGGALTIRFVDRYPERVRRFALLAPAGFMSHTPLNIRIVRWPFVGEWAMKAVGDRTIPSVVAGWIHEPGKKQEFLQKLQEQMKYKGFKQSFLATLRDMSFNQLKPDYERVGRSGKKGILLWGTEDQIVSFDQHILVQAVIPSIEFHAIEGGNHDLPPEKVTPLLIEFLKQ